MFWIWWPGAGLRWAGLTGWGAGGFGVARWAGLRLRLRRPPISIPTQGWRLKPLACEFEAKKKAASHANPQDWCF